MSIRSTNNCQSDQARRAREAERQRQLDAARRAAAEAAAKAAAEAAQQAAQRATRNVDTQNAARQVFAAGACHVDPSRTSTAAQAPSTTTANGPRRGIDANPVATGTKKIDDAAARLAAAKTDDEKRSAALDASRAVKDALSATKDPAAKKAILDASGRSLEAIGRGLDKLSRDDTKKAVANLADAAESAGKGAVDALAAPLARALPSLVQGHGDNRGEFMGGLKSAVVDGHGALLGASMTRALASVDVGLADDANRATASGVDDAMKAFADADKGARGREAELGAISAQWSGVLSSDQMQAGIARFQKEHGEFATRDAKAAALTRALDGVGYADAHGLAGDLGDKTRATLAEVPALARTDVGARAIGDALLREGRGESTFMASAGRVAGRDEKAGAELVEAAQRSILVSQGDAIARGDTTGLVTALAGAGRVMPDADTQKCFTSFSTQIEKGAKGKPPEEIALTIASAGRNVAGAISDQRTANIDELDSLTTKTSFKAFGAALGAVALGRSLMNFKDGVTGREALDAVVSAAGLGTSIAATVLKTGAPSVLSKGLPVVGYALSAFDTVQAVRKGDTLGAVAAAAPLAGAAAGAAIGAASGSIAPGVGTVIGGAVGSLVGLGIGVGRMIWGEHPDEKVEKSTQSFLQGALEQSGLSPEQAERASFRLRDVNGDFFGVGRSLQQIAQRTGESPQTVLQKVASLDDQRLHDFVKKSLDIGDNGDDVRDAENRRSEGNDVKVPEFKLDEAQFAQFLAMYLQLQ